MCRVCTQGCSHFSLQAYFSYETGVRINHSQGIFGNCKCILDKQKHIVAGVAKGAECGVGVLLVFGFRMQRKK